MPEPEPPGQKTLKQTTQDDPKADALNRKDAVLLESKSRSSGGKEAFSFIKFLKGSDFSQGTRFEFLMELVPEAFIGGFTLLTGHPNIIEGEGVFVTLTDLTMKINLSGKVVVSNIVKDFVKKRGADLGSIDTYKMLMRVYPGPLDKKEERAIKLSQSFEVVTKTQIRLISTNMLPPAQLPQGMKEDTDSMIFTFEVQNNDKPTLVFPKLFDKDGDKDERKRYATRIWVEEPGTIKQTYSEKNITINTKTGETLAESSETVLVRNEIEKLK